MTTTTKEQTARAGLNAQQAKLEERKRLPDQIHAERIRTIAKVEAARQDLQSYYVSVETGERASDTRERQLRKALDEAIAASGRSWGEREAAARQVIRDAEREFEEYVLAHAEDLAEDIAAEAEKGRARLLASIEELQSAALAWQTGAQLWRPLLEANALPGCSPRDLPMSPPELESALRDLERVVRRGLSLQVPRPLTEAAAREAKAA